MKDASLLDACVGLLRRDLSVAYRRRAEAVNPLMFFIVVAALFPLGVGADPKVLQSVAPGLIWVAALLATLLSLDSIFRSDFDDGTLEQIVLSAHPLSVLVLSKVFAHWLVTGLPLIAVAPLLGAMLGLHGHAIGVLVVTLALGTPVLSLIGAIGVALTVGLRRGGVLLSLLVLPLYVPVLVFGSSAVAMAADGLPAEAQLYMLAALLVLALTLASFPAAAALRISLA